MALVVADHRVEQLRPIDREGQKGEPVIGKARERVLTRHTAARRAAELEMLLSRLEE